MAGIQALVTGSSQLKKTIKSYLLTTSYASLHALSRNRSEELMAAKLSRIRE